MRNFLILLLLLLFSCNNQNNKFFSIIEEISKNKIELEDYSDFIVVPQEGCTACIGGFTRDIISSPKKYKNSFIIFTGTNDKKKLRLLLEDIQTIYLIDNHKKLIGSGFYSIYPMKYTYKNKKILKSEKLTNF